MKGNIDGDNNENLFSDDGGMDVLATTNEKVRP
jgi:hypothetical protein